MPSGNGGGDSSHWKRCKLIPPDAVSTYPCARFVNDLVCSVTPEIEVIRQSDDGGGHLAQFQVPVSEGSNLPNIGDASGCVGKTGGDCLTGDGVTRGSISTPSTDDVNLNDGKNFGYFSSRKPPTDDMNFPHSQNDMEQLRGKLGEFARVLYTPAVLFCGDQNKQEVHAAVSALNGKCLADLYSNFINNKVCSSLQTVEPGPETINTKLIGYYNVLLNPSAPLPKKLRGMDLYPRVELEYIGDATRAQEPQNLQMNRNIIQNIIRLLKNSQHMTFGAGNHPLGHSGTGGGVQHRPRKRYDKRLLKKGFENMLRSRVGENARFKEILKQMPNETKEALAKGNYDAFDETMVNGFTENIFDLFSRLPSRVLAEFSDEQLSVFGRRLLQLGAVKQLKVIYKKAQKKPCDLLDLDDVNDAIATNGLSTDEKKEIACVGVHIFTRDYPPHTWNVTLVKMLSNDLFKCVDGKMVTKVKDSAAIGELLTLVENQHLMLPPHIVEKLKKLQQGSIDDWDEDKLANIVQSGLSGVTIKDMNDVDDDVLCSDTVIEEFNQVGCDAPQRLAAVAMKRCMEEFDVEQMDAADLIENITAWGNLRVLLPVSQHKKLVSGLSDAQVDQMLAISCLPPAMKKSLSSKKLTNLDSMAEADVKALSAEVLAMADGKDLRQVKDALSDTQLAELGGKYSNIKKGLAKSLGNTYMEKMRDGGGVDITSVPAKFIKSLRLEDVEGVTKGAAKTTLKNMKDNGGSEDLGPAFRQTLLSAVEDDILTAAGDIPPAIKQYISLNKVDLTQDLSDLCEGLPETSSFCLEEDNKVHRNVDLSNKLTPALLTANPKLVKTLVEEDLGELSGDQYEEFQDAYNTATSQCNKCCLRWPSVKQLYNGLMKYAEMYTFDSSVSEKEKISAIPTERLDALPREILVKLKKETLDKVDMDIKRKLGLRFCTGSCEQWFPPDKRKQFVSGILQTKGTGDAPITLSDVNELGECVRDLDRDQIKRLEPDALEYAITIHLHNIGYIGPCLDMDAAMGLQEVVIKHYGNPEKWTVEIFDLLKGISHYFDEATFNKIPDVIMDAVECPEYSVPEEYISVFESKMSACMLETKRSEEDIEEGLDRCYIRKREAQVNLENEQSRRRRRKRSTSNPTCAEITDSTNGINDFSINQIQNIADSEIQSCVEIIGASTMDTEARAQAVWTRLINSYSSDDYMVPYEKMVNLGSIADGITTGTVHYLNITSDDVVAVIGQSKTLATSVLSNIADKLESDWKPISDWDSTDIATAGRIICGYEKTEVNDLSNEAFNDAMGELKSLTMCTDGVMEALATKAKTNLGALSTWSSTQLSAIGAMVGGLSADDLRAIPDAAYQGLTEENIVTINANDFSAINAGAISNLPTETAAAITAAQKAEMNDDMLDEYIKVLLSGDLAKIIEPGGSASLSFCTWTLLLVVSVFFC